MSVVVVDIGKYEKEIEYLQESIELVIIAPKSSNYKNFIPIETYIDVNLTNPPEPSESVFWLMKDLYSRIELAGKNIYKELLDAIRMLGPICILYDSNLIFLGDLIDKNLGIPNAAYSELCYSRGYPSLTELKPSLCRRKPQTIVSFGLECLRGSGKCQQIYEKTANILGLSHVNEFRRVCENIHCNIIFTTAEIQPGTLPSLFKFIGPALPLIKPSTRTDIYVGFQDDLEFRQIISQWIVDAGFTLSHCTNTIPGSARVIITSGDRYELYQALYSNIPFICIPTGQWQPLLAVRLAAMGFGVCIDVQTINASKVLNALNFQPTMASINIDSKNNFQLIIQELIANYKN